MNVVTSTADGMGECFRKVISVSNLAMYRCKMGEWCVILFLIYYV